MAENNFLKQDINNLRKAMGTLPNQSPKLETKFYKGVEGINVEMIDSVENPYKAMVVLATSCWGSSINKWDDLTPENRYEVVKMVLKGQALPLALESPSFTFAIEGPSRASFDQIARARLGVVFSAKGVRDNNWKDCAIRIPTELWPTEEEYNYFNDSFLMLKADLVKLKKIDDKIRIFELAKDRMLAVKELYAQIVDSGESWQAGRFCLPMNVCYGYSLAINFMALRNMCSTRMKFCEMADTVATAWLLQKEVAKKFPLLGSYLKPGCDNLKVCQYHRNYSLSEVFGCLFAPCKRNVCVALNDYSEFATSCSDINKIEKELGMHLERPNEWIEYDTFEILTYSDKLLFMA